MASKIFNKNLSLNINNIVGFFTAIFMILFMTANVNAQSRIKDIVDIEGVRDNMIVGYGLVVGLNGTGDDIGSAVFTKESLIGMLERLGVNASNDNLDTDNVAAVMVTATLPPFARQGSRIDVAVSTLGDAKSLLGGTLLVTPLMGADGEVYAVTQGTIAVGGFSVQGEAESVIKGVPTSGRIPNGAIIEREILFSMENMKTIRFSLRNPDFTTARRVSRAINSFIGENSSTVNDPGTVTINIPDSYNGQIIEMITDIEQLRVEPDQIAKVIIDEQNGVIVMGENVRINTVAIAQGNLTIRVSEAREISQPQPFSNKGTTETINETEIEIDDESERKLGIIKGGVSLQELVNGLNSMGVGPRDMITILQAIKASGALQADIEVL